MSDIPLALYYLAHARAGDKGDTLNISVVPYDDSDYPLLARELTPERVAAWFGDSVLGAVTRYDLPRLPAFNFVLTQALQGGVSDSLHLDKHGKSRSGVLLSLPIPVPAGHPGFERRRLVESQDS